MYWWIIVGVVTIIVVKLWQRRQRPHRYPKGYSGVPVLGVLPFLSDKPAATFFEWGKKMGPIYYVQLGMNDFVLLNDYKSIKECMVKQGKYSSGRGRIEFLTHESKGGGIIFQGYSDEYKTIHKSIVSSLRGSGIGKRDIEEKILEEVGHLTEEISLHKGKPFSPQQLLAVAVASNIVKITFGERLDYKDEKLVEILRLLKDIWNHPSDSILTNFCTLFINLKYFPVFSGAFNRLRANIEKQSAIYAQFIKQHESTFDKDNIRDAIDQMLANKALDQENPSFTKNQMVQSVADLFFGGTDTTATTLQWCLLYMAKYPDLQEKLFKEISQEIGSVKPRWEHKDSTPLTCSFIDEIARYMSIIPHTSHKAEFDFKLFDYDIPKGTMIFSVIYAAHRDPKCFENPEEFIPDRFIDKETGKFEKSKYLVPFGAGPRMCIGYQLAEKEIYMFLSAILQRFKVQKPEDCELPNFEDGTFGILHFPKDFKVCFVER